MKTTNLLMLSLLLVVVVLTFPYALQAEDQTRDRDRIQDPTTHDGDEPDQDRDRIRDRDRVSQDDSGTENKNSTSTVSTTTPGGYGASVRVRNTEELRVMLENMNNQASNQIDQEKRFDRELELERLRAEIGTAAFLSAGPLMGGYGASASSTAWQIQNNFSEAVQLENRLRSTSMLRRLLWGYDNEVTSDLKNTLARNASDISRLGQILADCDCGEELRLILQEQIRNIESEQARLRRLQENLADRDGILGFIFR